ncbi:MAG: type II secretion system protein GspG [Candidatus Methylomirabilales bacterium]
MNRQQGGLSLIELIVVLAALAILLALLLPVIVGLPGEADEAKARKGARSIGEAIHNLNKDLAKWPIFSSSVPDLTPANATLERLFSAGKVPGVSGAPGTADWIAAGNSDDLDNHLQFNILIAGSSYPTTGEFAWRGPYLTETPTDPWGNQFIINVKWLQPGATEHVVWVLSAGPNRIIETTFSQSSLAGDDIGFRLR